MSSNNLKWKGVQKSIHTHTHTHTYTCVHALMKNESRLVMSNSLWPHGLYSSWNSPGQNSGVGSLSLLQESNQCLLHCRWSLYHWTTEEALSGIENTNLNVPLVGKHSQQPGAPPITLGSWAPRLQHSGHSSNLPTISISPKLDSQKLQSLISPSHWMSDFE